MASRVIITVDGQQLDLPDKDLNLTLTYALKDRNGLAINTGSRSEYSFVLPATKQNDQVYQRFWQVGEINPDVQVFRPATIEVDGLPFFSGKSQLKEATFRADIHNWQGDTYKVAFYGDNIDWVADLQNKYLYNYDFGSFTYDYPDILADLANTYAAGDNFVTKAIKWKDWAYPDAIDLLDMTPVLFVKTIIDRIFTDLGYTVNSDFFDTVFFERLGMPVGLIEKLDERFNEDYLKVELYEPTTPLGTFLPLLFATQPIQPLVGPNPYNPATGLYTVPYDGYYLLKVVSNLSNVTGTVGLQIVVQQNQGAGNFPVLIIGNSNPTAYAGNALITGEIVVYANAGDLFRVDIVGNTTVGAADYNLRFNVDGEVPVQAGLTIDFKYLINKNWTALDFIKGLAHAFNLVFQTDVAGQEVTIEPSDTYSYLQSNPTVSQLNDGFYSTTNLTNYTDKVDLSKKGVVKSDSERPEIYRLSWKADSADPTQDAINKNEELKLMQGQYVFPVNRFKTGVETVENPFFAATLCIFDDAVKVVDSERSPFFPIIWKDNYFENPTSLEANYDVLPRLLVCAPFLPTNNGEIKVYNGAGFSNLSAPLAYMVNYNSVDGNFISLSFGNETINAIEVKGLLDRFYLREMTRRKTGKQAEANIFYDVLDIADLDFRPLFQIDGDNYILQEINSYNVLSNRSTRTYLMYNDEGDGTEADDIQSTDLLSKVLL